MTTMLHVVSLYPFTIHLSGFNRMQLYFPALVVAFASKQNTPVAKVMLSKLASSEEQGMYLGIGLIFDGVCQTYNTEARYPQGQLPYQAIYPTGQLPL